MERSHTLYSVTRRRLLLSVPLLIALTVPLAAHTQVQKTDARLAQAAKAVEAVTQGPGAAIGAVHGDVTGGPVGLASDGKGGYVLAAAGEKDKKQQQLTQREQEREREKEKERKEREKDKDDQDKKQQQLTQREQEREREKEKEQKERKKDKDDDEDDNKKRSPHKDKDDDEHEHKNPRYR